MGTDKEINLGIYSAPDQAQATGVTEGREGLPLAGKVGLVTGTRGIAAAVVQALAREGMRKIFVTHTGTKPKRVDELLASVAGIPNLEVIPIAGDISKPDTQQTIFNEINTKGHRLDLIFHDAPAGFVRTRKDDPKYEEAVEEARAISEAVNYRAKMDLTTSLTPLLTNEAVVVNIESPLSEYYGLVEGIEPYDPVAEFKAKAKDELPILVLDLNRRHGKSIRYASIDATMVKGTITASMLQSRYAEEVQPMLAGSEGGTSTSVEKVAEAVIKVVTEKLPFGYKAFVGVNHISPEAVVDQLDLYDETSRIIDVESFAHPNHGFGHRMLRKSDLATPSTLTDGKLVVTTEEERRLDPSLPDAILKTDDNDVRGHFAGEGNPKIVPLWMLTAAIFETAKLRYQDLTGMSYYVEGLRNLVASKMVLPGDAVAIFLKPQLVGEAGYSLVNLGVELKVDGGVTDTIDTLTIRQGFDLNDHLKPITLESAALASGLHALSQSAREGIVPLFRRVGSLDYVDPEQFDAVIGEGSELVTKSTLESNTPEGFVAQALTRVGSKIFARTHKLECGFDKREHAIELYNAFVRRRQMQRDRRAAKAGS